MCGIVFVGGTTLSKRDVDLFEKMLFCDTFRGPHSTGVFTKRAFKPKIIGGEPTVKDMFCKMAVEGPEFLKTEEWNVLRNGAEKTASYNKFYVGHNRYATVGAINAQNAHPFNEGKITMVHNGTLIDQSILPDSKNFVVDSNNIAHSLNVLGTAETIQKLDGAFTLVWHNSETETLHIIRNDERPFHLARSKANVWYGASEEDMLMWILSRGKKYQAVTVEEHFETKVGVEYIFNTADNKFEFVEEVEHDLPTFPARYRSYNAGGGYSSHPYGGGHNRGNSYTSYHGGRSTGAGNIHSPSFPALLRKNKIPLIKDKYVKFCSYQLEVYPKQPHKNIVRGKLFGFVEESNDYVEVINHSFLEKDFMVNEDMYGEVVSAHMADGILNIVVRGATTQSPFQFPKERTQGEEKKGEEESPIVGDIMLVGGQPYTRDQWASATAVTDCAFCSSPIDFVAGKRICAFNGVPVCDCQDERPGGYDEESGEETFCCTACGMDHKISKVSNFQDVCLDCYESFWKHNVPAEDEDEEDYEDFLEAFLRESPHSNQPKEDTDNVRPINDLKVLSSGLIVNEGHWDMICNCNLCQTLIPWEDAEETEFIGSTPVCGACVTDLNKKEEK